MGTATEYLDSDTNHLNQTIEKVHQLESAKIVNSLAKYNYDPSDIEFKNNFVMMITNSLTLLHQALEEEAKTYQKLYHADHPGIFQEVMNRCQEMKDEVFGSTIHTIKKILRSKNSPAKGIQMHPPYHECVFRFCEAMLELKQQMVRIMLTCRNQMGLENDIRKDANKCLKIYNYSYNKKVQINMPFIKLILKAQAQLDKDEPQAYTLACMMKEATNKEEVICQFFHAYKERDFQLFVTYDYADKIRSQKTQNDVYAIWGDNEEMAHKSIHVLKNFDSIGNEVIGKRLKAGEQQHNVKAMAVLMFYKWCTDRGCQCSESQFVHFFEKYYKGAHKPPSHSSVNGKKNRSSFNNEEYMEFAKKVDKIANDKTSFAATSREMGW